MVNHIGWIWVVKCCIQFWDTINYSRDNIAQNKISIHPILLSCVSYLASFPQDWITDTNSWWVANSTLFPLTERIMSPEEIRSNIPFELDNIFKDRHKKQLHRRMVQYSTLLHIDYSYLALYSIKYTMLLDEIPF